MDRHELEQFIVQRYQDDEQSMIAIFAQWCINHSLDPLELYARAYPQQAGNAALKLAIEQAVSSEMSEPISAEIVQAVLSMFDNEELAYVVYEEAGKIKAK